MGLGSAGLLWLPGASFAQSRAPRLARERAHTDDLEQLSERLRAASHDQALDAATAAIKSGADITTFLGAVFLAALRDIRPRPHGILHTVMMVESVFQLAAPETGRDAWLPVLFTLDDLKEAQQRDRREVGDWTMPKHPEPKKTGADAARRELLAAMDAWDIERADHAVVSLLPHCDRKSMFELLWPLAARCSTYIGHKMIYAAQIERVLGRIGWRYAEPALRSLVMTLLWRRDTELFEQSRERAAAIPATWLRGTEEPARSVDLLAELRHRDPGAARELAIEAFESGLGPATVWDALRLFGSEVFHRRPGRRSSTGRQALLPVHALTVTNAFGHAWRSTGVEATQRALVLQLASMLASMRDLLGGMVELSMDGPGLETLGASVDAPVDAPVGASPAARGADLDALFEAASPERVCAWLERAPQSDVSYLARLRRSLSETALEHHQHKFAAAMQEESALVHPRWRSRILAPAVDYLAHPDDPQTELYRRSVRALTKAGVG